MEARSFSVSLALEPSVASILSLVTAFVVWAPEVEMFAEADCEDDGCFEASELGIPLGASAPLEGREVT